MNYNRWNKSELIERIIYLESELNRKWNEEQYLSFIYDSLDSTLNGVIITDLDGIIRYVNHSFLYIFEYDDRETVIGNYAADIFVASKISNISDIERIMKRERDKKLEFDVYRNDGSIFQVEISASSVKGRQGEVGMILSFNDITERKKIERENKILSKMIMKSQELERQRVAKDLHDGVGQTILAAKLNFLAYWKDKTKHKDRFTTGLKFIDNASRELRDIYDDLYPTILSDMGLESTIRWYAKNSFEINKINADLNIRIEDTIPHALEVDIYRITKELFSNIIKHSGAGSVEFILTSENGVVNLKISDNGCGFDVNNSDNVRKGFGLSNIRQRVDSHGGSIMIHSTGDSGTSVKIAIMVDQ
ncbi:MAG TPA: PAS domain-containing sensor histidine kinase [Spirochaetota bacterium]|nr:PAS domain-containing sensor histidine kinase [Spirochaetota bacterium]HPJ35725.1 PAS domain-containing sensor histidine kinase [Spirochaetota bacterium]